MEKTMERIENILERATLDQLKIILRFLRNIIKISAGTGNRSGGEARGYNARMGRTLRRLPRFWT